METLVMTYAAVLICLIWTAPAVELPAGTPIAIRLKSKIASNASKPHDPIEAVVIQPVMAGDQFVIPYRAVLRGQVDKAQSAAAADQRADLELHFDHLDGAKGKAIQLAAKANERDKARE